MNLIVIKDSNNHKKFFHMARLICYETSEDILAWERINVQSICLLASFRPADCSLIPLSWRWFKIKTPHYGYNKTCNPTPMALTSARRTGFAICLILTILLVGLHFSGNSLTIQSSALAMNSSRWMATRALFTSETPITLTGITISSLPLLSLLLDWPSLSASSSW